jgi:hypothetical protein
MSADAGFRVRAREVRAYLRSLQSLERNVKPGRSFYRAAAAITASRAAAFIMIYNCVEYAAREAIIELRADIESNSGEFSGLLAHWREEIVRAHFYARLQQGTNHVDFLKDVTLFIPGKIEWKSAKRDLPFPGNIDHEELFKFVRRISYRWKPPKNSLGGTDLQIVRKMRNDLAHGHESFEAIGAQFSTQDIIDKFERIREFVQSFLRVLERYRAKQLYLQ